MEFSDPRLEEDATCSDRRTLKRSATRKHKCLLGSVRPVVSHESENPGGQTLLGLSWKTLTAPTATHLIGDGGGRWVVLPKVLSVPKGATGIPLLFLCPAELPLFAPSQVAFPGRA